MVTKIYLPAMRQPIVNGVRLGMGVALIGTLLAETKLSNKGIGFLIINAYNTFDMPRMYAMLIVLFVHRHRRQRAGRPRSAALATSSSGIRKRKFLGTDHRELVIGRSGHDAMNRNVRMIRRSAKPLAAIKLNLPTHRGAYYGGKWHEPKSGRYVDTINPGTGESLGKVADAGADDIDAAVAAAKAAFKEWRRVLPLERAKMLRADRRSAAPERRRARHDRRRRLRQSGRRDGAATP